MYSLKKKITILPISFVITFEFYPFSLSFLSLIHRSWILQGAFGKTSLMNSPCSISPACRYSANDQYTLLEIVALVQHVQNCYIPLKLRTSHLGVLWCDTFYGSGMKSEILRFQMHVWVLPVMLVWENALSWEVFLEGEILIFGIQTIRRKHLIRRKQAK